MIFKSDEELQAKCEEWQKRLRLQDWIVVCQIVRARNMKNEEAAAEVQHFRNPKRAAIFLRDAIDFPEGIFDQDMERDLIHELLHLYLSPLHNDENDDDVEQIIECLAHSFVMLYREKQSSKKELKAV